MENSREKLCYTIDERHKLRILRKYNRHSLRHPYVKHRLKIHRRFNKKAALIYKGSSKAYFLSKSLTGIICLTPFAADAK